MRELTYHVATSLDGFIAGPGGDVSGFPVTGDHVDWLVRELPDTLPGFALDALGVTATGARYDTTLMGWHTYAFGLAVTRSPYPHTRQVVFSRSHRPEEVPDDVTLTADPPVEVVRSLKAGPGTGIWLCGGGLLAAALADEVDRLVLKVNPVVLGAGTPLFDGRAPAHGFRLEQSTPFASGVVVNEYVRA